MKRALHADRDHPDVCDAVLALMHLFTQTGDLEKARPYFEESLTWREPKELLEQYLEESFGFKSAR